MPTWTGAGLIAGKTDVEAAIASINQNYRAGTKALAYPVRTADNAELTADASRLVPVIEELEPVVPWPGRSAQRCHRRGGRLVKPSAGPLAAASSGGWSGLPLVSAHDSPCSRGDGPLTSGCIRSLVHARGLVDALPPFVRSAGSPAVAVVWIALDHPP
jgi:hypothetical protein